LLRQDNADMRLSDTGFEIGLLKPEWHHAFCEKRKAVENEIDRLKHTRVGDTTLAQLLRRPEISYAQLPQKNHHLSADVQEQVETVIKYAGYISRQEVEASRLKALDSKTIPPSFSYETVRGLRTEARQKLGSIRPSTIAQALRISGVSPSDVSLLLVHLKRSSS